MNIQVRHISTVMNALGTNHDETSDAETNLNNFCGVPCKGSMRTFEQDAGRWESNLSVVNSHTDFFDPWTFLGNAHINAIHRCLNERVEDAQGLIIRHKDKVRLKEFIKGCNSCLRHAGNGLLVQDDVKLLNATPLFSNTEEEGLCRSNLLKKCLDVLKSI